MHLSGGLSRFAFLCCHDFFVQISKRFAKIVKWVLLTISDSVDRWLTGVNLQTDFSFGKAGLD